jgi:subtilase family serine protease
MSMRLPRVHRLIAFAAGVTTLAAVALLSIGGIGGSGAIAGTTRTAAGPIHAPAAASSSDLPQPVPLVADVTRRFSERSAKPPTTAQCRVQFGIACYSPTQYETAYDLNPLYQSGTTGKGTTIAIVDSFGSPTITRDLARFDAAFGLPTAHLRIIHPVGKPPAFRRSNATMSNWAFETSLDVEYAHAIAPKARLLLVETPTAEVEGRSGFPDMMSAESYVVRHHLADVISQSFGATENTFTHPGKDIRNLRSAFKAARKAHVTVLAGSGDTGATNVTRTINKVYDHRVNSWPSSDPLVTSVGGTRLFLNAAGDRTKPDQVWNDGVGAGGGGRSQVFGRPAFQRSVKQVTGAHRGTPDISMTAAAKGSALVYLSFPGVAHGFALASGTSEATPIFAGIIALADQQAGHDLGDINPTLYRMHGSQAAGIVDVTTGNNSFARVTGFTAKRGYDLASGWGTVDGLRFVQRLAR